MGEILSIEEAFGDLKDPRRKLPVHDFGEILLVALCAILLGAESWSAVEWWARAKLDWLRGHVVLANGVP